MFQGNAIQPTCEGEGGVVEVDPIGGEAPLDVAWQGVTQLGDTVQGTGTGSVNLEEGQYTWTVSDAAGCSLDTAIQVAALSIGLSMEQELVQPTCGGALAGEATLTPTGGISPYSVVVQGAADSTFLPFLVPGAYPVTLTDSLGCAFLDTVLIEPASDFVLFAEVDSATCANSEDGQVVLTTANGTGEVDFTFSGPFGASGCGRHGSRGGRRRLRGHSTGQCGLPRSIVGRVLRRHRPVIVLLDSLVPPKLRRRRGRIPGGNRRGRRGRPLRGQLVIGRSPMVQRPCSGLHWRGRLCR